MRLLCVIFCLSTALFVGCRNAAGPSVWVPDSAKLVSTGVFAHAPAPLVTPTYDGSGQAVEPTVLFFPEGWQGHLYWMVMSPYPSGNNKLENPSILVSEDGQNWIVPPGLANPIALPEQGHLSDATAVYDDESDQILVYFLNEVPGPTYETSLLRTTSEDGVHWSPPQVLFSGQNTYSVSPSVTKVAGTYYLWNVNSSAGCAAQTSTVNQRTSVDGVTWSMPQPVSLSQPGFVIWHFNMIPVPSEGQFMALVAAYPVGSNCGHTKLFFANSKNGLNWQTYPQPVMEAGSSWDNGEIYRSSFVYDPAKALFRTWYSACDFAAEWHIGYTEESYSVE